MRLGSQVLIGTFFSPAWGYVLVNLFARSCAFPTPRVIFLVSFNCKTKHHIVTISTFTKELCHSQTSWDFRCAVRRLSATQPSIWCPLRLKPIHTTSVDNSSLPLKYISIFSVAFTLSVRLCLLIAWLTVWNKCLLLSSQTYRLEPKHQKLTHYLPVYRQATKWKNVFPTWVSYPKPHSFIALSIAGLGWILAWDRGLQR